MAVSTTANYNKIIALPGGKHYHSGAHVDFADGTEIELDDRNIMQGYPSIEDKVSEEDKLEVGGAYASLLTIKLNNFENAFTKYDFKGAVIKPWVGLTTAVHWRDGEIIEKIPKGAFNVAQSPEVGSIISIAAYDNLVKMDVKYSEKSNLTYPATLAQIAAEACSICGVNLATAAFPNSDYVVTKRPDSDTTTCREILKYVAQLAGCFAKCNKDGDAEIRWYEVPDHVFDVGKNARTISVDRADVSVTGVQIQGNDSSKTIYKAGTDNYAIRIQDNPLAQNGLQSLVNALGTRLIGTQFAPYTASSPMNPAVETGDIVYLTDKKGVRHTTIVSGLQIEFGDSEEFSGDAESEDENQSERFDKADKAQDTADQAQDGVDEAKAEITTLNGQIVLKADKANLISQINICPETIKISSNRIEITGEVVIKSDLANGNTTIDGACIRTGRIESEDGDWWLDLETGEVYMKNGTFSGDIEWPHGYIHGGSSTSNVTIHSDGNTFLSCGGYVEVEGSLSVDEDMDVSGTIFGDIDTDGYSGSTVVQGIDGSRVGLSFHHGLLTDIY